MGHAAPSSLRAQARGAAAEAGPLAAASASLQEGAHTDWLLPSSFLLISWERGRCLPHKKHDIVAAPKEPFAENGEPGALLR